MGGVLKFNTFVGEVVVILRHRINLSEERFGSCSNVQIIRNEVAYRQIYNLLLLASSIENSIENAQITRAN